MPYQIEIRKKPFTSSCLKKLQFPSHIHPHLELIYLKRGTSIVTTDNKKYCLGDGDLLLIFPNQIHSYRDETSIDASMLIFAPDLFSELKEVLCTKTPVSPIIHRDRIPTDIAEQLTQIHQRLNTQLIDAPADQDCIKRLLIYCTDHYTEPISLELLAKELHLNKYYISHIFQEI